MNHGFHGRTLATMSASGKPGWDKMFAPQVEGFPKAEINDLESVRKLIDDQTVAIMLEPVQGEAGVIPATKEFMQGLRKLADEHKLLFIVDEVQTGMGRTGTMFAYQQSDGAGHHDAGQGHRRRRRWPPCWRARKCACSRTATRAARITAIR